jgi:cytochrome c553
MHHNRKHRAARLIAIAATAAALLFVLSIVVKAQTATAPSDEELASGLTRAGGVFHATAGDVPPPLDTLKHGREIALSGGKGAASAACASCHGVRGEGNDALGAARLTGLPAWYLKKQMKDYATGARKSAIMAPIAAALPDSEANDLASYYAVLAAPLLAPAAAGGGTSYGARLASFGNADKAIPACVNCHGPLATGLSPSVPYLAGQNASYLADQLRDWLEGSRANDEGGVMHSVAQKMTDEDIRAVTEYYQNSAR